MVDNNYTFIVAVLDNLLRRFAPLHKVKPLVVAMAMLMTNRDGTKKRGLGLKVFLKDETIFFRPFFINYAFFSYIICFLVI